MFSLSLLAQFRLRSITLGSGYLHKSVFFSLLMLERHPSWRKTEALVDIPPSHGDIPVKCQSFPLHLWHSWNYILMGSTIYSRRSGRQCPSQLYGVLEILDYGAVEEFSQWSDGEASHLNLLSLSPVPTVEASPHLLINFTFAWLKEYFCFWMDNIVLHMNCLYVCTMSTNHMFLFFYNCVHWKADHSHCKFGTLV